MASTQEQMPEGEMQSTAVPTPEQILQIGFGYMASKTLLSAVELGVYTALGAESLTGAELAERVGLHARSRFDFLDALVSMGLLQRAGGGAEARYANTAATGAFLDKASPAYMGGILEMVNARLYGFWGHLTEALRTGLPQNEAKHGEDFFGTLYADEARLEGFLRAMEGIQMGNFAVLLDQVDLSSATTLCDVGGASGLFCTLAAQRHPHLRAVTFDLPAVEPIARRTVERMGVSDRVEVASGDFFVDAIPRSDVVVMGNILHGWDDDQKLVLVRKAYAALNDGGRFIAVENLIDDDRCVNTFGLLMSLNMLIENPGGSDYTAAEFAGWCSAAGFTRTEVLPLAGPASAAIAYR
jgi:hypothetical protein